MARDLDTPQGDFMFSIFLFVTHLVFALYMLGTIWFIQLIHYPTLFFLPYDSKPNPILFYQGRAGIAVILPMILELASIVILMFIPFPNFFTVLVLLILSILIWISTFTIQLPVQNLLKKEKNEDHIKRLISTNWFRTGLWSLKAIYLFFVLWTLLSESFIVIS